ncbi:hypothetical protein [Rubinisphaera sp.]|uniref:hypothetical protein n=1 Tax=Rubinisphaera sp. TaxID=2024857 RepID=UPI000C0F494D|nr:hypothetical protein [Rubinisphaera sp.]MBV11924.1 hypothetical protein [Rubinisphaera sp.]
MSTDEWFRRTTWTDEDRTDFHAHLNRARKYNRPQYLRIQASHLADVANHAAALELLDHFLQVDDGAIDLAQAHLQRAEAFLATGCEQEAIDAFRASLEAERKRPNVQTEAWLLFPWFIVETQETELYPEANSILSEFSKLRSPSFPVSNYRFHCVMALLLANTIDQAQAISHAKQALAASDEKHSGYRYHPNLGLVQDTNNTVHERIAIIADT